MTPKPSREDEVKSLLMQPVVAGIQIAPTLSMTQRKDLMFTLHARGSWLRKMEYLLTGLAALAIASILFEFVKRHF